MTIAKLKTLVDSAKVIRPVSMEAIHEVRELDLAALAHIEPARPQFLLPVLGALPLGEPTLLAAHGGGSKSTLATQLVTSLAAGVSFMGEPAERLRCAFLSFEDPEPVLHWRLRRACYAAGTSMQEVIGHLRIFDGTTWAGAWFARREDGTYGLTEEFTAMRKRVEGCDLIVVDGAADVYAGNENDRAMVKAFVRGLRTMVPRDGALLLLAHIDKQGSQQGSQAEGYSGSTGWHNSVRSRLFMYRETLDEDDGPAETGNIVLEVKKSNYGKVGGRMVLRYDEQYDCLRRIDAPTTSTTIAGRSRAQRELQESMALKSIVAAAHRIGDPIPTSSSGTRSAHAVMQAREGFPDDLRGKRGKARFYQAMERMRASGELKTETLRKANRHHIEVYVLPASEKERASVTEHDASEAAHECASDGT